jgi:hypothetical protein
MAMVCGKQRPVGMWHEPSIGPSCPYFRGECCQTRKEWPSEWKGLKGQERRGRRFRVRREHATPRPLQRAAGSATLERSNRIRVTAQGSPVAPQASVVVLRPRGLGPAGAERRSLLAALGPASTAQQASTARTAAPHCTDGSGASDPSNAAPRSDSLGARGRAPTRRRWGGGQ